MRLIVPSVLIALFVAISLQRYEVFLKKAKESEEKVRWVVQVGKMAGKWRGMQTKKSTAWSFQKAPPNFKKSPPNFQKSPPCFYRPSEYI
jgi:hypothetical protein